MATADPCQAVTVVTSVEKTEKYPAVRTRIIRGYRTMPMMSDIQDKLAIKRRASFLAPLTRPAFLGYHSNS